jgi:hypothetical protein
MAMQSRHVGRSNSKSAITAECSGIAGCPRCQSKTSSAARFSATRLPPHVDASLVKPQRTTLDVYFVLKLIGRDRLLAQIAKLSGAFASEILLWWSWRER